MMKYMGGVELTWLKRFFFGDLQRGFMLLLLGS